MLWNRNKGKEEAAVDKNENKGGGAGAGAGDGDPAKLPEGFVAVKKEDWDAVNAGLANMGRKLDVFEQAVNLSGVNRQPAAPAGPTVEQQLAAVDEEIIALDDLIDKAYEEEKPTAALRRKQLSLVERKSEIRLAAMSQSLEQRGVGMFEQITNTVMTPQLPMLKYPTVKREYEALLAQMTPNMRANPAALKNAYSMAVGMHIDEVMSLQAEETTRAAAAAAAGGQVPRSSRRQEAVGAGGGNGDGDVSPEEHFGPDAVVALQSVGRSLDRVAQAFGFKDAKSYAAFDSFADDYELGKVRADGSPVAAGGGK